MSILDFVKLVDGTYLIINLELGTLDRIRTTE